MIRSYLTTALRSILSHRGYAAINVLGLAIGVAACFLMVVFIRHELSYDRYHEHGDRMYRLTFEVNAGGTIYQLADSPGPAGPALEKTFPEVEVAARIKAPGETLVSARGEAFKESRFYYADPELLDVFSIAHVSGDLRAALTTPHTVLLTESTAKKYFGAADPLGKVLRVGEHREFTVGGLVADPPDNTHVPFDFLASFASLHDVDGEPLEIWGTVANYYTYFLLTPGTEPATLSKKLESLTEQHLPVENFKLGLQPVPSIHLHSNLGNELQPNSDIRYVYLFAAIAGFILLLACINFTNLATARASVRMREVGIRKVMGADRRQLAGQFLGESVLFTLFAVLLGAFLAELFLPVLNATTSRSLSIDLAAQPVLLAALVVIGLIVSVVAGSYPAFVLSSFRPIEVLHGRRRLTTGSLFRKGLVVFQFGVTSVMLIGTVVVSRQMDFIREMKLGFEREQILFLELNDDLRARFGVLKQLLAEDPGVVNVSGSSSIPTRGYAAYFARPEGGADEEPVLLPYFWVDGDFLDTYGISLVEGRWPPPGAADDSIRTVVVNETAVRQYGLDNPIGKRLTSTDFTARVAGVVRDFHVSSLRESISPLTIHPIESNFRYVSVRVRPGDVEKTIARLKGAWDRFAPGYPFDYTFLDDQIDGLYESERRLGRAAVYFSALAIFIACIGLFALAAFTISRRRKEIGVRKVMGATVTAIVVLLSKEFTRLVLIGFVVAVPVAHVLMDHWLEDFAYRVSLGFDTFVVAGLSAVTVAFAAVAFQTIRAGMSNPVDSIRYE